ncbi:MarR family winged helix-turn-helix transcriptional regulator [Celerinatantimonas yamalensis]|uniref:MarR family transcriptional regulator n=1 Tax=Celerinatantimonas yamalensis TaxID=559956 RepID=A0ABW9G959_9GAMM
MGKLIHQEVFHLMRRVFQLHTAAWQKALPTLTKPQMAVLRTLAEHPGIEQIELMAAAASSKATLAEMLRRLEQRQWLYRQTDTNDRRRRFVHLTEQGEQLVQELRPQWEQVDQQFLQRLSTDEQGLLLQLLTKLAQSDDPSSL